MKLTFKRLFYPLLYCGIGFLNILLLFFPFAGPSVSYGDERVSEMLSGYGCMSFGDESLFHTFIQAIGRDMDIPEVIVSALAKIVSGLLILVLITSILMLIVGMIELVRLFAKVNLIPGLNRDLVVKIEKISALSVSALTLFACMMATITFLVSKGKMVISYVGTLKWGIRPGASFWLLLLVALSGIVLPVVLEIMWKTITIYGCPRCGALATAAGLGQPCMNCGTPIASAKVPAPAEASETDVQDINMVMVRITYGKAVASTGAVMKKYKITPLLLGIVAGALVVVIVLAIVLATVLGSRPAFETPDTYMDCLYKPDIERTIILKDGKSTGEVILGQVNDEPLRSMDGTVLATLADTATGSDLFVYDGNLLKTVEKNVESALLSVDGSTVLYLTEADALMSYDVKQQISTMIVGIYTGEAFCLSPDGRTIAYNDEDQNMFIYQDGEKTKYGSHKFPLAISNRGEFVYFGDYEKESVYVGKKNDAIKLGTLGVDLCLNADHTEVLINSGTEAYTSVKGSEKVKIAASGINDLGGFVENQAICCITGSLDDSVTGTLPLESFKGMYFLTENGKLCYLNKKRMAVEVAENVTEFRVSDDGDYVYYTNYADVLFRGETESTKFKALVSMVEDFEITSNGKGCYVRTESDELIYIKKDGKGKVISQEIDSMYMSHDDYVFFTEDTTSSGGTLYVSEGGSQKTRVDEDVRGVSVTPTATYFYVMEGRDEYSVFGASKKTAFEKIMDYRDINF